MYDKDLNPVETNRPVGTTKIFYIYSCVPHRVTPGAYERRFVALISSWLH